MKMMKAMVKLNAASNDFVLMDVAIPVINEKEMLVKVKAIGVGIQDGYFFPQQMQFPYPIGLEASGSIEKLGSDCSGYKVGDRITFISIQQVKGGTWAEYAVLDSNSLIVPIPEGMTFAEAAAIPVAGNAALKALHAIQVKSQDTLFIAGASGAIGTFLIQMASAKGCIIIASASSNNHEYMKSLGAKMSVDYHDSDWVKQVLEWKPEGVDKAIGIQPGTGVASLGVVKEGGKIISVTMDQFQSQRDIEVVSFPYNIDLREELVDLIHTVAHNQVKLFIENTYAFEDALEALAKVGSRRARGKSVIVL